MRIMMHIFCCKRISRRNVVAKLFKNCLVCGSDPFGIGGIKKLRPFSGRSLPEETISSKILQIGKLRPHNV